ncbi:MAG: four helix bundle protein [Chloroflexi bacterium]|nr:four helix bundle protein [Chloroflexota bacterium]
MLHDIAEMADEIWRVVLAWDVFAKDVVGKQLTRAVDSIGANVSEAYGRFHYGEKLKFLYYARGSLFETKYWLNRSCARNLIDERQLTAYSHQLNQTGKQLNAFARSLKTQRQKPAEHVVREQSVVYASDNVNDLILLTDDDLNWLASPHNGPEKHPISQSLNLPISQSPNLQSSISNDLI